MVHAFPFKEKSSFVKVVGKNELGKNMMHKCKWVHQNVKFHSGCVILVRFIYTNEIRHVTDLWLLLYLRTWFSYPPIPTALQLPGNTHLRLRHFPAPTQQSELIAPTHKKKKKITRRAATRFRSVLVYLRLVSLKIVPPLFFFLTEAAWSCTEQWRKSDTGAAPRIRPLLYVQTSSITPSVKPCKDGTKRRDF